MTDASARRRDRRNRPRLRARSRLGRRVRRHDACRGRRPDWRADLRAYLSGLSHAAGQGAVGAGHYPNLAHDDALAGRLGEVAAASIVLKGRNGMPAFGHPQSNVPGDDSTLLSDAQIAEIVNYIRSHFGNRYQDRVTAAQVAKLPHPTSIPSF